MMDSLEMNFNFNDVCGLRTVKMPPYCGQTVKAVRQVNKGQFSEATRVIRQSQQF